jgi:hypothetical protein
MASDDLRPEHAALGLAITGGLVFCLQTHPAVATIDRLAVYAGSIQPTTPGGSP